MNNIELAKELILSNFSFLEKMGYTTTTKMEKEKAFLESIDVNYFSNEKKREVCINYNSIKIENDIHLGFSASITRLPYSGVSDLFSLYNFLDSMGKNFPTSQVNQFDRKEADKELKQIVAVLKQYASKIIAGIEWKEDYYPRW